NEVTAQDTFAGNGLDPATIQLNADGTPSGSAAADLRAMTTTQYDDQGRVFSTKTFSVDPVTGAIGNALTSQNWYDQSGELIKILAPSGLVTKMQYDGGGRTTGVFATDGGSDTTWADAGNLTGDIVLSQSRTQYDADGDPILIIQKDRFHDDPSTATGA